HGGILCSHSHLAALVAADASALHAGNIPAFLTLPRHADGYSVNLEDDIAAA
ncbi:NAD(P)(+) transhydrogenase (Re/Si-specific) subunit alpha, partial [Pseudomonas aeruginosa]